MAVHYRKGTAAGGLLKRSTGLMKIKHMDHVLDFRASLAADQEKELNRKIEAEVLEVTQQIRDILGDQAEYNSWWESAPEAGFLEAAKIKLNQLKTHSISPAGYVGREVPRLCPDCGLSFYVNQRGGKCPQLFCGCPNFHRTGCNQKLPFTAEIMYLIDMADAARRLQPAEF